MNLSNRIILPGATIGIIGGGQLGRMMALAAKASGFRIAVLDPGVNSPCGQVADVEITAAFNDEIALQRLIDLSDVITYEFENIDYESLKTLEKKANLPQGAELIRITQDRILEKEALTQSGVKIADYRAVHNKDELINAVEEIGCPSVLKTARGGYDGKGQVKIDSKLDLQEASGLLTHGDCVLEKWLSFEKEISVIVSRGITGEISFLPIGENIHQNHILHQTIVPARIDKSVKNEAIKAARQIAEYLQLVGTLAVEMFLTKDGEIYMNELAPRPHNSGHYSIEACETSQFVQHIRAICGWPLGSTNLLKPAVMVNVLGEHLEGVSTRINDHSDWSVHLYGKKEAKYQRKMGHITILTDDIDQTLMKLDDTHIWKNGGNTHD
jgi:5-(carboxyamino)imidazole ribonucleotide synthase